MHNPKISIVTITFNSERTIRDTLESIRCQQYDNLEYIIVDGGSTDSTKVILDEYKDIISVLMSEPDEGISDAMNKGISLSTGELIGIIHSDDMLMDGALSRLANEWDNKHDIYYGHSIIIDEEGNDEHILCAEDDLKGMEYGFRLVHASTFVTKNAYEKYGMFDKKLKCAMDYDLILRMYNAGAKFKYIDAVLAKYRVGGTNMKNRRRTVDEVRDVSVAHGANKIKANYLRNRKLFIDFVRPVLNKLHLHSRRVKKL